MVSRRALSVVNGTLASMMFFVVSLGFKGYKAVQEERLLTEHFPKEYAAYKSPLKRSMRFVWSRTDWRSLQNC